MRNQESLPNASTCEPDLERSDNNVNDLFVISSLQTEDKDGKGYRSWKYEHWNETNKNAIYLSKLHFKSSRNIQIKNVIQNVKSNQNWVEFGEESIKLKIHRPWWKISKQ